LVEKSFMGGIVFAKVGDRIVVRGHKVGQSDRYCAVVEVHNVDGGPPYVVQWDDNDHQELYFPGSDSVVISGDSP